jgi:DNA-binding transcriptional LysR family regulator
MEMREMRSLLLLDETGSIHEVAARVHLTAAAIHGQLKALEREFGTRLYEKRLGRLELNTAGRMLLPFVNEVLAHHDAAHAALLDWNKGLRGFVRLGAGPTFSILILPELVRLFRAHHPGIEVFIESGASGHILDRLRAGNLDLAFDIAPAVMDDPQFEPVASWKSRLVFVSAPGLVKSPGSLKQLESQPFILFQKGSRMERIVQTYLEQINFSPKVMMRADSSEAIKAMIRARLGISVLFAWNVTYDLRSRALSVVRVHASSLNLGMALIRIRSSYTSPAMREFISVAKTMAWPSLKPERKTGG